MESSSVSSFRGGVGGLSPSDSVSGLTTWNGHQLPQLSCETEAPRCRVAVVGTLILLLSSSCEDLLRSTSFVSCSFGPEGEERNIEQAESEEIEVEGRRLDPDSEVGEFAK